MKLRNYQLKYIRFIWTRIQFEIATRHHLEISHLIYNHGILNKFQESYNINLYYTAESIE